MSRLDLDALSHDVERAHQAASMPDVSALDVLARVGRRRLARRAAVVGGAVVLLVCGAFLGRPAHPGVRVNGIGIALNAWVVAQDTALTLDFADESQLTLREGGRVNVERVGQHSAVVRLDRAAATIAVKHHDDTHWVVNAGPWTIEVTGTRFTVSVSEAGALALEMLEGSVRVSGPDLDGTRVVLAGQRLDLAAPALPTQASAKQSSASATQASPSTAPPATAPPATAPPATAPKTLASPTLASPTLASPTLASSTASTTTAQPEDPEERPGPQRPLTVPAPSDWRQLARAGRFDAAFLALAPLADLLARSERDELLLLADVLRLTNHGADARQVLNVTRARFPGTPEAARASFSLGVLAFPSAEAIVAFETYLREAPDGVLTEQALSRQLECHQRLGQQVELKASAVRYLARFPDGSSAALAQRVLDAP